MTKKLFYWNLKDYNFDTLKAVNTQHHFKNLVKKFYVEKNLFVKKKYPYHKLVTQIVDTNSEIFASTKFLKKMKRLK